MNRQKILKIALLLAGLALAVVVIIGTLELRGARAYLITNEDSANEVDVTISGLEVHLLENGEPVGEDGLLSALENTVMDPGYTYPETIAAQNSGEKEEFVRVIVKKYWYTLEDGSMRKHLDLNPDLIQLSYQGQKYNSGAWTENKTESSKEQSVYYLNTALDGNTNSADLFDGLKIDAEIADQVTFTQEGNVITGNYQYSDVNFAVEVEVQSVQMSSGEEAIKSAWGISNITVSGNELTVEQEAVE